MAFLPPFSEESERVSGMSELENRISRISDEIFSLFQELTRDTRFSSGIAILIQGILSAAGICYDKERDPIKAIKLLFKGLFKDEAIIEVLFPLAVGDTETPQFYFQRILMEV